ncbi:TolC family protein [Chitinophaga sancti]|uniref:TolC family protein n=1 Tax=Chitinophaga sancti TaxID=1004 RepID=UPI003F795EF7
MRDTIIAIVVTLTVIILIGLDFISQYQIQSQQDNFKCSQYVWPYSFYVGVQLNIPIFNGFKNGYKAKQSTIALQELQNAAERLNSKALLEYRKAGRDYKEAIAKV